MKRHRWKLSNGLTVLYQENPSLPLAAGSLLIPSGTVQEELDQAGVACLTTGLLFQGSKKWSAKQIADKMESRGASIGAHASEDYLDIGFLGLGDHFQEMLSVVHDTVTAPRHDPKECQKEKSMLLASLDSRHDSIFNRAYDALLKRLYGSHPYARPTEGHSTSVKKLERSHLREWHTRWIVPNQAVFSLVGPWPLRIAEKQLARWSSWKAKTSAHAIPQIPTLITSEENQTAPFEQAYLMRGTLAPDLNHPDYLAVKLLNVLVGGGMSSRLFSILREQNGLAYEVSSFYPTRLGTSHWVMYLGLPSDKLPQAETLLNQIIRDLIEKGPTAQELQDAKRMVRGSFLAEQQTRRRQAWYAAWWELTGRGAGYGKNYLADIDAVRLSDVKRVARTLLEQPAVWVRLRPGQK